MRAGTVEFNKGKWIWISEKFWPIVRQLRVMAVQSGKNYETHGYKVIYELDRSSEDTFINLWHTDGIFAIAFAGHGGDYEGVH